MSPRLLSDVTFGAFGVYSPRGKSKVSVESQAIRAAIKSGRDFTLDSAIRRILEGFETSVLSEVLGPDVVLVPMPGHSLRVEGGFWGPLWIAEALVAAGLGREVMLCLERVIPVPKSAFAARGNRTNAERHFETMSVTGLPFVEERVTIVDDIITKGDTLLGAASRLGTFLDGCIPRGFALIRTMGLIPDVDRKVDPCLGTVTRNRWGDSVRDP